MSRSRRVAVGVFLCIAGQCLVASFAAAQIYPTAFQVLDYAPGQEQRNARLLGMGNLTMASDLHTRLGLWDFARAPVGVLEADTTSTLELWPNAASGDVKTINPDTDLERQTLMGMGGRVGYEVWRRVQGSNAFGLYGTLESQTVGRPFNDDIEQRGNYQTPSIGGIFNSKIPFFQPERTRYSLRAFYAKGWEKEEYLTMLQNPAGQYLGKDGDLVATPDFFTPDEFTLSTLGGGGGLSYRLGSWLTAAVNYDYISRSIDGENSDVRHFTGTTESRPYGVFQAAFTGKAAANALEYGFDARTWSSDSEVEFNSTLSAGLAQQPFSGRGLMLTRDESGSLFRGRARWTAGAFEANAGFGTGTSEVNVAPPSPSRVDTYNYFLNTAYNRFLADSLVIPDSIHRERQENTRTDLALGGAWQWSPKGRVGVEFHQYSLESELLTMGKGPELAGWDVRTGAEMLFNPRLTGRLGYIYSSDDHDELTAQNEFIGHTLTIGFGIAPPAGGWRIDAGYAHGWADSDYPDPTEAKANRRDVAAQIRWAF